MCEGFKFFLPNFLSQLALQNKFRILAEEIWSFWIYPTPSLYKFFFFASSGDLPFILDVEVKMSKGEPAHGTERKKFRVLFETLGSPKIFIPALSDLI